MSDLDSRGDLEEEIRVTKKSKKTFGRGIFIGVLATLAVICLVALILVKVLFGSFMEKTGLSASKLTYIITLMENYFYQDVDEKNIAEGIYKGVLDSLEDKYSTYYTAEEFETIQESVSGSFYGIGVTITKDESTGQIVARGIVEDSPAEKAGLLEGDILISADDVLGADVDVSTFAEAVRGEEGTTVSITYERDGQQNTIDVVRGKINEKTVDYKMVSDEVGYIYISSFAENTPDQFKNAITSLQEQGMTSVIFDVRYNPGGVLDSVVEMLDYILPEGTVVYTEDKSGNRTDYTSDAETYLDMPMVVLTSENSASASEIFAGAIRDFEAGTLIGTTTYGKGVVQSTIPLSDGSAVKITTATYYTPSGECIHGTGIKPDVELEYEFLGEEGDSYDESLDNQIQKAIEVLTKSK